MDRVVDRFDRPAWITAGATLAGYLVVLAFLTILLFVVPYLLF